MTNATPIISIATGEPVREKPKCAKCVRDTNGKVIEPCARHTRKYVGRDNASLSAGQLKAFLRAAEKFGKRELALFIFGFAHGNRISEVAHAKLSDLHFNNHTVTVRRVKGSYNSQPMMLRDIFGYNEEKVLRDYIDERKYANGALASDWLFLSQKMNGDQARPLTTTQLYRLFVSVAQGAGLPEQLQHPHVMRHSMGFLMRKNGSGIEIIQKVLGHVNVNSTSRYTNVTQEDADRAVDDMFRRMNHKKR